MREPSWVPLHTYPTGLEAEAARVALETAEIPVLIPGQQVGIFGPGFHGSQPGGYTLLVPAVALEHARDVLGLDVEGEA